MRLKNVLIVVKDLKRSERFYHELFGVTKILEQEGNMILTEGLVLQEEKIWQEAIGQEIQGNRNSCELYFEEKDLERFIRKLEELYPGTPYVNRLAKEEEGRGFVRLCDPDGNRIEVGSPVDGR